MNDMNNDVTELLRRRAAQVPPHREVPASMTGRVRRRVVMNALAMGVAVVLVGGIAVAGLRTLAPATNDIPGGQPGTSASQQTSSGSAGAACTSAQLSAQASMEGAAGSREGVIVFTNVSGETCTLEGRPEITLLDANGQPITSSGVTFSQSEPGWSVNGFHQPAGWPVVTLTSGDAAFVRIRWSNWCPDGTAVPAWHLDVPGGGTVAVTGIDAAGAPPCNGQSEPSTIEEGPFEPGTGR
jgi:hypothetical protein